MLPPCVPGQHARPLGQLRQASCWWWSSQSQRTPQPTFRDGLSSLSYARPAQPPMPPPPTPAPAPAPALVPSPAATGGGLLVAEPQRATSEDFDGLAQEPFADEFGELCKAIGLKIRPLGGLVYDPAHAGRVGCCGAGRWGTRDGGRGAGRAMGRGRAARAPTYLSSSGARLLTHATLLPPPQLCLAQSSRSKAHANIRRSCCS